MSLKVDAVQRSTGFVGGLPNEDRTAFKATPQGFHAWVIDGGTSPDPALRVPARGLAGAWLAEEMTTALLAVCEGAGDLRALLQGAIERIGPAWRAAGLDWPDWAQPVGALSLLRLRPAKAGLTVEGLHLGGCPVAVLRADGRAENLHGWTGVRDDESRRLGSDEAAQAAGLDALRARRARQQTERPFSLLTLDPACATDAAATQARLEPGDRLIVASDGIARAWNEYALLTPEDGARRLGAAGGFEGLLEEMRAFERHDYAAREARLLKVGDDASAVIVSVR